MARVELHRRQSSRGKQQKTKVCHDVWILENSWQKGLAKLQRSGDQRITLGRIVAGFENADSYLFLTTQSPTCILFITHSGDLSNRHFTLSPRSVGALDRCRISASVAGGACSAPAVRAPAIRPACWPGSSSGCGGAPGSCTGGGISGRGLPGGLSCGGSVGFPGVARRDLLAVRSASCFFRKIASR